MISQLLLKTREMAMHITMLNQENERMMHELERLGQIVEEKDEREKEKDTVCR